MGNVDILVPALVARLGNVLHSILECEGSAVTRFCRRAVGRVGRAARALSLRVARAVAAHAHSPSSSSLSFAVR